MKRRLFAFLLTLCMAFAMLPVTAFAASPVSDEMIALDIETVHVSDDQPVLYDVEDSIWIDDNEYMCFEDACDELCGLMVRRYDEININVHFAYSSEETVEDEAVALAQDLAAYAMAHGDYYEYRCGDYLYGNVTSLGADITIGIDDTYAYLTILYKATYLTTWEQEEELDEAVMALHRENDMGEFSDPSSVRALYDYITANVAIVDLDDVTDPLQHSAYAALINGEASVQGVALLVYYLALWNGVDCRIIPGTVNGQDHLWTIVETDDLYYNLDPALDVGAAEYRYFMVCPDNFTDHVRQADYDTAEFHTYYPMAEADYDYCFHTFDAGVVTTEPTCAEEGVMTYTCTLCGKTRIEYLAMVDHTYDGGVVTREPTCSEQGATTFTCTLCGASYEESIPTIDHTPDAGEVDKAPTCTESGSTKYSCIVCNNVYWYETIPALGHSYEAVTTEATCTTDGETVYTCSACGDSYTEAIPALGHSWDEGVVTAEATCTENGAKTKTCAACGEVETEIIPALGHTKNDGTVTQEATCTVPGVMTYVCTVCAEEFTEEIPTLAHDYADGFCTVCGQQQLAVPTIESCYSRVQTSVKVTWTADENADGYELWRTTTPDDEESWTRVKTMVGSDAHIYTNQGLTIGTTYYYKVRAYAENADGSKRYTDFSEMDYMPAAVVFNGPYGNSTQRVRLLWNEVGGAHGYQIWRMNEDGSYSVVKTLGDRGNELTNNMGSATAYSNDGLEAGTQYTYKMRAFMIEDGKKVFGAYSDEVTIATMPEAPVVTGTSPRATRAQLTWDAVEGAAGYQIWMAESADGEYKIVKSITDGSTTYTKYDLAEGTTYYFKVRAYTEVEGKKTFGAFSDIIPVTV